MKLIRTFLVLFILCILAGFSIAQTENTEISNGTIVEQSPYIFPTYDSLPNFLKGIYTKETYKEFSNSSELELLNIKYISDGLKIAGFIYKPRIIEGKRLPAIIINRGGVGKMGQIDNKDYFFYIYEMYRYASEGFVVLASQYRGAEGSEGKDEIGGADLNDVMNLIPLAKSLGYVDMENMFMQGLSRGGLMTLLAIKEGFPLKAAVIVGGVINFEETVKRWPIFLNYLPDYDTCKEEYQKNRSAIYWANKIDVPLLIFFGGEDNSVPPSQALSLAQELEENGKLYELVIYAKDGHVVSRNREERLKKTIDWYKNPRTIPIRKTIKHVVIEEGVDKAIELYFELKKHKFSMYDFNERELNSVGYGLLRSNKIKEAIEIFKVNVSEYPDAWNPYDSLGEAYMLNGDRELAIKNYNKSLELNPNNTGAIEKLKELNAK